MDQWWLALVQHYGGLTAALSVALVYAADKAGLFRHLMRRTREREEAKIRERQTLSADEQAFRRDLLNRVGELETKLALAEADYEKRLVELRRACDEELAAFRIQIAELRRGEMRWRHLANNMAQYILSLTRRLTAQGITDIPPFEGWEKFQAEGGDHGLLPGPG